MVERNIYLIQWFGPFNSKEDLKDWEIKQKDRFYLYLFQGKRTGKHKYKYYCGSTYDRKNYVSCVFRRLGDSNHHIHQFEEERRDSILIWVGIIANRDHPSRKEVLLCEKMLICEMAQLEIEDEAIENVTNTLPPKENVYIISEWYNSERSEYRPKFQVYIPNIVPDVIKYYAPKNYLYRSKHLKLVGVLKDKRDKD